MSTFEAHPSPIDAQRIVNDDRDGYTIQISLTGVATRDLLKALGRRALLRTRAGIGWRLLAIGDTTGDDQDRTLTALTHTLGDWTPTWDLSPDDATALGNWLLEQAEEPPTCRDCDRLLDTTNDPDAPVCGQCVWSPRIGA